MSRLEWNIKKNLLYAMIPYTVIAVLGELARLLK